MGRKKLPAGQARTYELRVRMRPHVKDATEAKRRAMSKAAGYEVSFSKLVREAVWAFCKDPDDPREA